MVKSIMDYIFRWLAIKFLTTDEASEVHNHELVEQMNGSLGTAAPVKVEVPAPVSSTNSPMAAEQTGVQLELMTIKNQSDAPPCDFCGAIMVRNGSCYKCHECGNTTGCS